MYINSSKIGDMIIDYLLNHVLTLPPPRERLVIAELVDIKHFLHIHLPKNMVYNVGKR